MSLESKTQVFLLTHDSRLMTPDCYAVMIVARAPVRSEKSLV